MNSRYVPSNSMMEQIPLNTPHQPTSVQAFISATCVNCVVRYGQCQIILFFFNLGRLVSEYHRSTHTKF